MQDFRKKWFKSVIEPCPELNERESNSRLQYEINVCALLILQPYKMREEL